MTKDRSTRRTTVCLFSFHPLLPSEFQRVLPEEDFRPLFRRVDPDIVGQSQELSVPRASVFVLEAHRRPQATEDLAQTIVTRYAGARLLVIAEKFTEETAFPLLRLGAKGLLRYSEVSEQLPRALRVISDAGFWVPRTLLSRFVESTLASSAHRRLPIPGARRLSRREKETLDLLLENLSNKEIASKLNISARTAKFHVSNLLSKHGVRRRADLILLAHTQREIQ